MISMQFGDLNRGNIIIAASTSTRLAGRQIGYR
jgi:hypothetical protein